MSEQVQKLETTVTVLKSRLFDTQEQVEQAQAVIKQLSEGMQAIVEAVGVQPDEQGNVAIQAIVDAVKALVPEQLELDEVEPEAE